MSWGSGGGLWLHVCPGGGARGLKKNVPPLRIISGTALMKTGMTVASRGLQPPWLCVSLTTGSRQLIMCTYSWRPLATQSLPLICAWVACRLHDDKPIAEYIGPREMYYKTSRHICPCSSPLNGGRVEDLMILFFRVVVVYLAYTVGLHCETYACRICTVLCWWLGVFVAYSRPKVYVNNWFESQSLILPV